MMMNTHTNSSHQVAVSMMMLPSGSALSVGPQHNLAQAAHAFLAKEAWCRSHKGRPCFHKPARHGTNTTAPLDNDTVMQHTR